MLIRTVSASARPLGFILLLLAAIFAASTLKSPAGADDSGILIIPPNDGYGFEECLSPGSQCGLVVADAWCKAHGFSGSKGFGPEPAAAGNVKAGSVRVTCGGQIN